MPLGKCFVGAIRKFTLTGYSSEVTLENIAHYDSILLNSMVWYGFSVKTFQYASMLLDVNLTCEQRKDEVV